MKNLMNKTALAAAAFALALAFALTFALNESPSALAQSATPTPTPIPTLTPSPQVDYDADNDGLIEISYPDQLSAMRHDPDGDGNSSHGDYAAAFPNPVAGMGCKLAPSVPPDPSAPSTPRCEGYELTDDIDLSAYSNWTPIPAWETTFSGENPRTKLSHSISNMTANGGLFGNIGESGEVRNVALKNATSTFAIAAGSSRPVPPSNAGVLAAANQGRIKYVQVQGSLTFTGIETDKPYAQVGGLVGQNNGGTITLSWADVEVNITGSGARAGGFIGDNRGDGAEITASVASGDLNISVIESHAKKYYRVGGFVGTNKALITHSMAFGEVSPRVDRTNPFGVHCWGGGQWIGVVPSPSGCKPKD